MWWVMGREETREGELGRRSLLEGKVTSPLTTTQGFDLLTPDPIAGFSLAHTAVRPSESDRSGLSKTVQ